MAVGGVRDLEEIEAMSAAGHALSSLSVTEGRVRQAREKGRPEGIASIPARPRALS